MTNYEFIIHRFRPKNDRPNVPVEAYHPDIPDQVEVRKELVSNKSQYLPKSVYDPDMNPVPHLDQLQQKGTKSRTSVPIPFTLPHRVQEISQQTTGKSQSIHIYEKCD